MDEEKPALITDSEVITPGQVHEQIRRYMDRIPDMAFVLVVARKGDYGRVAQTRNVERHVAREMLRTAQNGIDQGRVVLPGRG